MIPGEARARFERTSRDRRRAHTVRIRIFVGIAIAVAFAVGVALGQALQDNPRPGGQQTSVRTLPPLTQTTKR